MLLPGGQKFEVYRIGYGAVCCGNLPGGKLKNCPGQKSDTSAPEVWMDYRCHAPGRFVGTNLPPGVEPFLRRAHSMSEMEVFTFYKMAHPKHAAKLKEKVRDMLDGGFERALLAAYGRQRKGDGVDYGNDFYYGIGEPCCATREGGCAIRGAAGTSGVLSDAGQVWAGNAAGREATALWKQGEVKLPNTGKGGLKKDEDRRRSARRLLDLDWFF
ncbi:hypothetical protein N9L76_08000 [bacterium]|nr:hypothetical protein [bacterium]